MGRTSWTDPTLQRDSQSISWALVESTRQIQKWGVQTHSPAEWFLILGEEIGELGQAVCKVHFDDGHSFDFAQVREEAIQVAALALKIAEMADLEV
jgi:NTP pyrophosphatase (non-canonical NTP hydrolase)